MMLISKVSYLATDASVKKLPRWSFPASFLQIQRFYGFYLLVVLGCLVLNAPLASAQTVSDFFSFQDGCRKCVEDYDPTVDYFPHKVSPAGNSLDWDIDYNLNYKIIRNLLATKGTTTFYAYLCGTPEPEIPDGVDAVTIEIPIRNYALVTTTHAGYLEQIAQLETFAAYPFPSSYFSSNGLPCMHTLSQNEDNQVAFFEDYAFDLPFESTAEFFSDVTSGGGEFEERNLDVIFVVNYNAEVGNLRSIEGETTDCAVQIEISESLSDTPIQHLEWVEYVSAFFNKEELAAEVVDSANTLYDCHKASVDTAQASPSVLYLTSCPIAFYGITTYGLGSTSSEFYHTLIADANGEMFDGTNINSNYAGSVSIEEFETFFKDEANAVDIVITATSHLNCNTSLPAFANAKIFSLQSTNVWFGSRFLIPDRTLVEFISMIQPSGEEPLRIMYTQVQPDLALSDFEVLDEDSCDFRSSYDLNYLSVQCEDNTPADQVVISEVDTAELSCVAEVQTCGAADNAYVSVGLLAMALTTFVFMA